jgi:hypothetical protein
MLSCWLRALLSHRAQFGGFRRVRSGAIVSFVGASCATRARFVATILSLALIYAFTCAATCAICFSPGAGSAAQTQGHACEHAAGGSHRQEPAKPDCIGHHHSGFEVVQSDGHLRFQLSVTGRASVWAEEVAGTDCVNVASSFSSDLAPPRVATIFPWQKSSILRI